MLKNKKEKTLFNSFHFMILYGGRHCIKKAEEDIETSSCKNKIMMVRESYRAQQEDYITLSYSYVDVYDPSVYNF